MPMWVTQDTLDD